MFLYSRPALWPNYPSFKWVIGFSAWVKLPLSVEVINAWSYGSISPYAFIVAQEIFIFVQFFTNFGVPQCEIFLVLLSLPRSQVRIFSLASRH